MKKIYYLKTCDTCKRILKNIDLNGFELQDIKSKPLKVSELEELYKLSGSYDALFSKLAKKYKELDLKNHQISEEEMKNFILEEYTFLKRPVIVNEDKIFIGSGKKNLELLYADLGIK
ncbi:arsenate reductase family protein [Namhaeicola litoreus]|uniref:Arsenate reductase family protein n=1 Tax=Namhaeicola litoreus TaxID=1052145 RepID=A0ABW3Y0J6_9FLAO